MTDELDDLGRHSETGGGFYLGLLGGLALGVGVGLLLAPRRGAELRQTLARSANDLQRNAAQSFRQVSGKVRDTAGKVREGAETGREMVRKAAEAWNDRRGTARAGGEPFAGQAGPSH